ncbi:hypothetical protein K1719_017747 [Acacia pycnantha]|nr:hypothetical protein K1719_017747 [Acacia pycnantha]
MSMMIISADTTEPHSPPDSVTTSAINGSAPSPFTGDQNPSLSSASSSPPPELHLQVSWPQDSIGSIILWFASTGLPRTSFPQNFLLFCRPMTSTLLSLSPPKCITKSLTEYL